MPTQVERAAEGTYRPQKGNLVRREVLPDLLDPDVDTLLRKPRPVDTVEGGKGNSRSGIPTQVGVIVVQLCDRHAAPELGPPDPVRLDRSGHPRRRDVLAYRAHVAYPWFRALTPPQRSTFARCGASLKCSPRPLVSPCRFIRHQVLLREAYAARRFRRRSRMLVR